MKTTIIYTKDTAQESNFDNIPTRYKKPKKRRFFDNSWAQRLPKGMQSDKQGVLVQIDHMTCRVGDKTIKHFNAWDRKTKINVAEYPFKIESVQVDGGSEFMKEFEQACQEKNIILKIFSKKFLIFFH